MVVAVPAIAAASLGARSEEAGELPDGFELLAAAFGANANPEETPTRRNPDPAEVYYPGTGIGHASAPAGRSKTMSVPASGTIMRRGSGYVAAAALPAASARDAVQHAPQEATAPESPHQHSLAARGDGAATSAEPAGRAIGRHRASRSSDGAGSGGRNGVAIAAALSVTASWAIGIFLIFWGKHVSAQNPDYEIGPWACWGAFFVLLPLIVGAIRALAVLVRIVAEEHRRGSPAGRAPDSGRVPSATVIPGSLPGSTITCSHRAQTRPGWPSKWPVPTREAAHRRPGDRKHGHELRRRDFTKI